MTSAEKQHERTVPHTRELSALGLFVLATVIITWPLILSPGEGLVRSVFGASHLFTLEWARAQLVAAPFEVPIWCNDLGYPGGGLAVLIGWPSVLLGLVLRLVFSPLSTYNLIQIFQLVFACWVTYRLARAHDASHPSACLGALVFGLSPLAHSMFLIGEVPNLWHGLLPAAMLALWHAEARRSWAAVGWGSFTLILANLATPYLGIFSALLLAPYALVRLGTSKDRWGTFARYALMAGIAAIAMLPVLNYFAMLDQVAQQWLLKRPASQGISHALGEFDLHFATVRALLEPGEVVLPEGFRRSLQIKYLGLASLLLAGIAASRREKGAGGWWLGALWGVSLSMGPLLHLDMQGPLTVGGLVFSLPMNWLGEALPFFEHVNVPYRAGIISALCLAMGIATGLRQLTARWVIPVGTVLLLADAILLSPVPWPAPVAPLHTAPFYEEIGKETEDYAILPFPFECRPEENIGRYVEYQALVTIHNKRTPWIDSFRADRVVATMGMAQPLDQPLVQGLCSLQDLDAPQPDPPDTAWFASLGFRWLVLHTEYLQGVTPAYRAWLDPVLGQPRESGTLLVYPLGEGVVPEWLLREAEHGALRADGKSLFEPFRFPPGGGR